MRKFEKPVVETNKHGQLVETHPAYGVVGASRISGDATLFGSDVKHFGFVRLRVSQADKMLGSHEDHVCGQLRTLCEVDMSEAQWVALVSRMNIGEGTPCTLRYHCAPPLVVCPEIDDGRTAEDRIRARAASIGATLDEPAERALKELEQLSEKLGKKDRDRFMSLVRTLLGNVSANVEFGKSMLTEHAEKLVNDAKVEIHAAINAKITSLGIERLQEMVAGGSAPTLLPSEGQS